MRNLYGDASRRERSYYAPARRTHRRRPGRRGTIVLVGAVAALGIGGVVVAKTIEWVDVTVTGVDEGQVLRRFDVEGFTIRVAPSGPAAGDVRVELNGEEVATTTNAAGELVARPDNLAEGPNELVVTVDGRYVLGGTEVRRTFTVNTAGPVLSVPRQIISSVPGRVTVLRGLADNAVSLSANGSPVELEPGGQFRVFVPQATTAIELEALDVKGNPDRVTVAVMDEPDAPEHPHTVGVHISAEGWADPALREDVLEMARAGRINVVQLDIKDESGQVGYDSDVAMADEIGATNGAFYDPEQAIDELHGLGVRVVGRIVCFLDPVLAKWAWDNGRPELVVLSGSGSSPLANDYGTAAFTSVANDEVRQYQIDLAVEAVGYGFDEILYDYVRRPEGDLSEMTFTGLDVPPEVAVARFVESTSRALDDTEAELGISVFGVAATKPEDIGQDIGLLAPFVDYVSPMVYPSHWGSGQYGVDDPVRQPGAIVERSLADFHRLVAGSGAAVVPWLQDFSTADVAYGGPEVRAQIKAAWRTGSSGFILWNSGSVYHEEALPRDRADG
ncbi:MAG: hypothetical protein H0U21_01750 [Acidimicrobiia bacterium]|nr:hypothetical protein [Acidimicrobiia bacterium]